MLQETRRNVTLHLTRFRAAHNESGNPTFSAFEVSRIKSTSNAYAMKNTNDTFQRSGEYKCKMANEKVVGRRK